DFGCANHRQRRLSPRRLEEARGAQLGEALQVVDWAAFSGKRPHSCEPYEKLDPALKEELPLAAPESCMRQHGGGKWPRGRCNSGSREARSAGSGYSSAIATRMTTYSMKRYAALSIAKASRCRTSH